ncbi:MAG TPA: MTH1187 family thiamine-binding protein [Candidatus Aphodovivens avistercoris]|nr:MTH1187 family thiamine-binding protein [Candidatus Aphodovivens avistercoris]
MNTLVAVAIAPFGVGDELSAHVAEVVRVIRASGLPNKTCSMFTEIEGEWDEVMRVVKEATMILAEKGIRTEVVLKADVRPGREGMMSRKVEIVEELLGSAANVPSDAAAGESVSIPSDAAAGDQSEKTAEGRAENLAEGGAR